MRHSALIAFALYTTSLPIAVSFIILLVTMITSSAVLANSLMTRYTIWRREASLFWNSLEMPKKRSVASRVGNFSPVKRRRAIFVSRMRHFRGDTGEVLKTRAVHTGQPKWSGCNGDDDGAPSGGGLPSWKTEVRSTLTTVFSSSSFLL